MLCQQLKSDNISLRLEDAVARLKVSRRELRLDSTGNLEVVPERKVGRPPRPILSMLQVKSETECWNWNGAYTGSGYGTMRIHPRSLPAPRAIYLLTKGKLDNELEVAHLCDNKKCCNPFHLVASTHKENMHDAYAKKRIHRPAGEKHFRSKLNRQKIAAIRRSSLPGRKLAEKYGVSKSAIEHARRGDTWKHVT